MLAMRKAASHRSELVNQLLFGESIEVKEQNEDWAFVQTKHDNYSAWIDFREYYFSEEIITPKIKVVSSFYAKVELNNSKLIIPFGSLLTGKAISLLEGSVELMCTPQRAIDLICDHLLHSPYLWGGRTPFGIDCSGLTQLFFRLIGIVIPRDANLQVKLGDDIFLSQIEPGDTLFFKNSEHQITHVGIAIDKNKIIHASGNVRIDNFDERGIFNQQLRKYTHQFSVAKRIIKP